MRKCYLHIGSHKTGTSAIQKVLADNQLDLQKHGIFYSLSCKHTSDYSSNPIGLAIANKDLPSLESLLNKLTAEILEMSDMDMILSSEILEKCPLINPALFELFIERLSMHFDTIDIIYCIRDPYALCNSIFKQFVSNLHHPYSDTIDKFITQTFVPSIKIDSIIQAWSVIPKLNQFFMYWYSKNFIENFKHILDICGLKFQVNNPGLINKSIDGIFLRLNYYYNTTYIKQHKMKPEFFHHLKHISSKCQDDWYFKTSIIDETRLESFNQMVAGYGKVPTFIQCLNAPVLEDKNTFQPLIMIDNQDQFELLVQTLNNRYHTNIYP